MRMNEDKNNRLFGHVIENSTNTVKVSKNNTTYILEGSKAQRWWKDFRSAKARGYLSSHLDNLMIELGQQA